MIRRPEALSVYLKPEMRLLRAPFVFIPKTCEYE